MIDIEAASVHQLRAAVRGVMALCDNETALQPDQPFRLSLAARRTVRKVVASALAGEPEAAETCTHGPMCQLNGQKIEIAQHLTTIEGLERTTERLVAERDSLQKQLETYDLALDLVKGQRDLMFAAIGRVHAACDDAAGAGFPNISIREIREAIKVEENR